MFPGVSAAATEIVIAITGQSSSTEVVQGKDTGATLCGKVRRDLIDADAQTLDDAARPVLGRLRRDQLRARRRRREPRATLLRGPRG